MRIPKHTPLYLILLLYLVVATLFAVYTPAWQAPDEPAHYNYVRQLANGRFPVMEPGDYDQEYINRVVFESGFDPQYDLTPITYEDWQPPLYYLLLTPVYWASNGSLLAMRLASLLLGAGVVALAYGAARRAVPQQPWIAAGTAAFVAFLPQHLAILSSVNNDALAELLIAAIVWRLLSLGEWNPAEGKRPFFLTGLLLGLGYLTKGTVYPLTVVAAVALLWRYRQQRRTLLEAGAWLFVPALLIGSLWWGRNVIVYGGLDILGKAAHDAVVLGQPRTADLVARQGVLGAAREFFQTTFRSFWGQFGWMAFPMLNPGWLYPLLWLFTGAVALGLISILLIPALRSAELANRSLQLLTLLTLFAATFGVHVTYNLTFVQHQGRYLFPALVPIGIGVMIGLEVWIRPFARRWAPAPTLLAALLAAAMFALNLWVLFRIIPLL